MSDIGSRGLSMFSAGSVEGGLHVAFRDSTARRLQPAGVTCPSQVFNRTLSAYLGSHTMSNWFEHRPLFPLTVCQHVWYLPNIVSTLQSAPSLNLLKMYNLYESGLFLGNTNP